LLFYLDDFDNMLMEIIHILLHFIVGFYFMIFIVNNEVIMLIYIRRYHNQFNFNHTIHYHIDEIIQEHCLLFLMFLIKTLDVNQVYLYYLYFTFIIIFEKISFLLNLKFMDCCFGLGFVCFFV
jgi:hypothetical protein